MIWNSEKVGSSNMSDSFKIRNGLKQGNALYPLIFNFALEYSILKMKKEKKRLSLNCLNQLFVYADEVDLIVDDINALQNNTVACVEACDEIGLQINIDKRKYMITSRNTGNEGNNIRIRDEVIEKVNKFKYFGAHAKNKNQVTEEIKKSLSNGGTHDSIQSKNF